MENTGKYEKTNRNKSGRSGTFRGTSGNIFGKCRENIQEVIGNVGNKNGNVGKPVYESVDNRFNHSIDNWFIIPSTTGSNMPSTASLPFRQQPVLPFRRQPILNSGVGAFILNVRTCASGVGAFILDFWATQK